MKKADKYNKNHWQYDAMKSVRKQMPNPTHRDDDDSTYDRRNFEEVDSQLPTIEELMHDAESIATIKGHSLSNWKQISETCLSNYCTICQKPIIINSDPLQAELDIDGLASKEDCITETQINDDFDILYLNRVRV